MKTWIRIDEKLLFGLLKKRSVPMDRAMRIITSLGNFSIIWIAMSIFSWFKGYQQMVHGIVVSLLLTAIANNLILKTFCMRQRPCDKYEDIQMLIKRPFGSSFPSGHAATSFACATAMAAFDLRIGIVALIVAAMIAISRVYLFVHFPSDVVAGVISGIVFARIGLTFVPY